jgi:AraC-like DNA-binding protein
MSESRQYGALSVPIASAVAVVAAAAPRVGARHLCDDVGIEPWLLSEPGARIPMRGLAALYESAARLTGDRAFGLHVGERIDVRQFEYFGYIMLHSATLGLALERAARYLPLWTDGARFRHERDAGWVRIWWEYADPDVLATRQDSEMSLATVVATCRRLTGGGPTGLAEAWFRHDAPRDRTEHDRVFRARLRFNMPGTALLFRREVPAHNARAADERLCELIMRCADAELERGCLSQAGEATVAPVRDDTPARAREWLRFHLEDGHPRLDRLARELGMSPRALQRALGARGTSYAKLLGEVRREIAEDCLGDASVPLAEIGLRLGFSQPNEFHRAFREWTGVTPARFRESRVHRRDTD